MDGTSLVLLLAALCAAPPASAFLQGLLLPLQQGAKHAPQPYPHPQSYYQHRRASYDQAFDAPAQQGYVTARPVLYQWLPSRYGEAGTAHGYSNGYSNPLAALWQQPASWLPWAAVNRQPSVQAVQPVQAVSQAQPLSASTLVAAQPAQQLVQQPQQQPFQAIWSFLPWNSNAQQTTATSNPVLAFFQNPAALLPWVQQNSRPVVYTMPLATHPAPSTQALHVAAEQVPVSTSSSSPSAPSAKPEGVVLDEADNGVRRISVNQEAVHGVHPCP